MRGVSHILVCGTALLLSSLCAWSQSTVVLSESRSGGIGTDMYQEISGRWYDSVGKSEAPDCTAGIGSRWMNIQEGPSGAVARWTLTPPQEGIYEAQVTWSSSGNARGVTYTIAAGDVTQTVVLTQDGFGYDGPRNCNQWISLGSHRGGPMAPIVIEVSDAQVTGQPDEASAGRVYTDAARLIAAGGVTLPAAPISTPAPPAPRFTPPPAPTVVAPPPTPAPSPAPTFGAASIAWNTDLDGALRLAASSGKRVLACFVTSASRDARIMESETWRDPTVISAVTQRYVAVRISMEQQRQLCASMGVFRSPTTLILQPGLEEPVIVDRMIGHMGPEEMLAHLR